ncbi:hypothetical protein [Streptomyces sp. NPDC050988]|uniref:hypothetical protein n=1 Tax=Streptomyces sp. NPDC050988 TaxID=3365637 RepID=UPI003796E56E
MSKQQDTNINNSVALKPKGLVVDRALLTTRSALILLLAVLCGIGTGILTTFAGAEPPEAVLCGMTGLSAAVPFFNGLID